MSAPNAGRGLRRGSAAGHGLQLLLPGKYNATSPHSWQADADRISALSCIIARQLAGQGAAAADGLTGSSGHTMPAYGSNCVTGGPPGAHDLGHPHTLYSAADCALIWLSMVQGKVQQPLTGWWGHAKPFDFETHYRPATDINHFQCSTPNILAMTALEVCSAATTAAAAAAAAAAPSFARRSCCCCCTQPGKLLVPCRQLKAAAANPPCLPCKHLLQMLCPDCEVRCRWAWTSCWRLHHRPCARSLWRSPSSSSSSWAR